MTARTVITNAGPLMALAKLNQLHLLAELYGEVTVPDAVYSEVVTQGLARGEPDALVVRLFWNQRKWPIAAVGDMPLRGYHLEAILDRGESAVLALGLCGLTFGLMPRSAAWCLQNCLAIELSPQFGAMTTKKRSGGSWYLHDKRRRDCTRKGPQR